MRLKYVFISLSIIVYNQLISQDHVLWYKSPASYFEEALPIGNGKAGAMVYGGIKQERLSLNDITLWSGEPVNTMANAKAYTHLPAVREALFNENYEAADTLVRKLQGNFSSAYEPLGNLLINFDHSENIQDYKRYLDLSKGVCTIEYKQNQTTYTRTYFYSHPDQVLVIRLNTTGPEKVNCTIHMNSSLLYNTSVESNQLVLKGRAPVRSAPNYLQVRDAVNYMDGRGTRYVAFMQVENMIPSIGKIHYKDSTITIIDGKDIILKIALATSWNGFDKDPYKQGKNEIAIAQSYLDKSKFKYTTLLSRHINDFKKYYDRVSFTLNTETTVNSSSDIYTRIRKNTHDETDIGLIPLYFNYGRYLMISSSRTLYVPMNLQGLWNEQVRPPWSSNYTVNINTEMNYWPVEVCNLTELHKPLLSFIDNLSVTGAVTAKTYYDDRGWVCHHNSDIWAMSNPVGDFGKGSPQWANWQLGGAWLSTHLWEHFAFTTDSAFLRKAYPILKGAAIFCLDQLVEDKQGTLVTAPSTSPENVYITDKGFKAATLYGSTADLAMIRQLFSNVIAAGKTLHVDHKFRDTLTHALNKMYPYQISKKDGVLQEWYHDWDDAEITHRHLSHLFGVYPGNSIDPDTKEYFEAATKSLRRRTNNGTGWSISWKISMWARLLNGEKAYDAIKKLLAYYPADKNEIKMAGGGTYPNLFDAHPPFQIDGNFGGTAGIAEMLLQSHQHFIHILPALPKEWSSGKITGLKARGNITVDIAWANNNLINLRFLSAKTQTKKIKYRNNMVDVLLPAGKWVTVKI